MTILSITIENVLGEQVEIPLDDSRSSNYLIIEMEGLGSPKNSVNTMGLAGADGAEFNSVYAMQRTINLTIGFENHVIDVTAARQLLYRLFDQKRETTLIITTDSFKTAIKGWVEENKSNITTKISHNVISIICPDPFFRDVIEHTFTVSGINSLFEFPFSNESLTESLIEFSTWERDFARVLDYEGEVETGFIIQLLFDGPATDVVIYHVTESKQMAIDTSVVASIVGGPIQAGDKITINTAVGQKAIEFYREGVAYNIINALSTFTDWLTISPGPNEFTIDASNGLDNVTATLFYQLVRAGV